MQLQIGKIDFTNKKTLTITIIVILLIFAIVYVCNNRKNTVEGFAQYNINSSDLVSLYGLDNVVVGSSNPISLSNQINNMIDNKSSTLNSRFVGITDFEGLRNNLTSNASSLLNTINQMNSLRTKLNDDLSMMQQIITSNVNVINNNLSSNVSLINNNLTSNVALLNTGIYNAAPPFTIVAFYGSTIPSGWQLCDGATLLCVDGRTQVWCTYKNVISQFKTPNLLGRTIIGARNNSSDTNNGIVDPNNQLSKYTSGNYGGVQNHTLIVNEMPAHNHSLDFSSIGCRGSGCSLAGGGQAFFMDSNYVAITPNRLPAGFTQVSMANTGGSQPHNNMQPWFALKYIIKQPPVSMGGNGNPLPVIPEGYNENSGINNLQ